MPPQQAALNWPLKITFEKGINLCSFLLKLFFHRKSRTHRYGCITNKNNPLPALVIRPGSFEMQRFSFYITPCFPAMHPSPQGASSTYLTSLASSTSSATLTFIASFSRIKHLWTRWDFYCRCFWGLELVIDLASGRLRFKDSSLERFA